MPPSPFSGETAEQAREIWLVDKAPGGHPEAGGRRDQSSADFMQSPRASSLRALCRCTSLKGDEAQRRLHHDTSRKCSASKPSWTSTPTSPQENNAVAIEHSARPQENLRGFQAAQYLETAQDA
jgi:hypothetical protein